jgi:hypothetical protein
MRRSIALLAAIATASCSAPQTQPPNAPPASSVAPPSSDVAARTPVGPLVPVLPANPSVRAAIGVPAFERLLGRLAARLDPRAADQLARMLGVESSVLRSGQISAALGLDPAGTVQMAFAPLDAAAMRDVRSLHALAESLQGRSMDAAGDAVSRALDAPHDHVLTVRFVAPARDPSHLVDVVHALLDRIGWTRIDPPEGVAEMLATPDAKGAVAISRSTDAVVFDLILAPFVHRGSSAVLAERVRPVADALRRQTGESPHGEPLAIGDDALRVEVDPVSLASTNLLLGVAMVRTALANVDPQRRAEIGTLGLSEANQSLSTVRNEQGTYFDRIALGLRDDLSVAIRADIGPSASIPPESAWAPSVSVTQPGGAAQLDLGTAFVRAWRLPNDPSVPATEGPYIESAREAGGLALAFAFPYFVLAALRHALYETPRPFPRPPVAYDRFERISSVTRHDPDDVFVGLFPPNVSANDAACVLVAPGERCTPTTRLALGRTVSRESHAVRLTRIGNRFALLVASTPAILEAAHVQLTATPVPPARIVVDLAALDPGNPFAAMLPGSFEGTVAREASQLVFSVSPRSP